MKATAYSPASLRALKHMSVADAADIIAAIDAVAAGEIEATPLRGQMANEHKVRAGGFRAVIRISADRIWVDVVAARGGAYKSRP